MLFTKKSLVKRGERSWRASFSYKDPSTGKTKVLYKTFHADGKRAAKAETEKILLELNSDGVLPDKDLTVEMLMEEHLQTKVAARSIEESTVRSYRCDLRLVRNYGLGGSRVQDLTIEEVNAWIALLLEDGYAPRTIRRAHDRLKAAISYAIATNRMTRNVCLHTLLPKSQKREYRTLSMEERRAMYDAVLEGMPNQVCIATFLALTTGLRRGEICGLRFSDFNVERRTLSVVRAIAVGQSRSYIKDTKTTSSSREVPLSGATFEVLLALRSSMEKVLAIRDELGADPYICGTWKRNSKYYHPTTLTKEYRVFCSAHGLPEGVRFHDLRHTWATMMVEAGVDAASVASMLGHSRASITLDIYANPDTNAKRSAAARIDGCLGVRPAMPAAQPLPSPGEYSVEQLEQMLAAAKAREVGSKCVVNTNFVENQL